MVRSLAPYAIACARSIRLRSFVSIRIASRGDRAAQPLAIGAADNVCARTRATGEGRSDLKRSSIVIAVTLLAMAASGCSGGWWPFGRSGGEANRIPSGASEFVCAEGKRLIVRFDDGAKSAWVFLPDREFRLQQSGSPDRYTNGVTTLSLQGDSAHLDSEGSRQFADCKRKSS